MILTYDTTTAAKGRPPTPPRAAELLAHVLRDLALSYEAECPGGFARFRQSLPVE